MVFWEAVGEPSPASRGVIHGTRGDMTQWTEAMKRRMNRRARRNKEFQDKQTRAIIVVCIVSYSIPITVGSFCGV